jgi:hypothetical protein
MKVSKHTPVRGSRGQSLVETVLMLPLVLLLVFNVVNFGYFFLVALNLTGASRTAAQYSVSGFATPAATVLPQSGPPTVTSSVSYLATQDLSVLNSANVSVRVCSPANPNSNCSCSGSSCAGLSSLPSADPEANFVLNRVDIVYTFKPLISGAIFNLPLQASAMCNSNGTCTFVRHAEMRTMN